MNITSQGPDWFHENVWNAQTEYRDYIEDRSDYYEGDHDILDEDDTYADGTPKTHRVMNWIRHIIQRHTGAISAPQVTLLDVDADAMAMDEYKRIYRGQRLESTDKLLVRDALLSGVAVEFHAFDAETKEVLIYRYDPSEWCFLWDSDGQLAAAVRYIELPENTVHRGELYGSALRLLWIYTAEEIGEYQSTADDATWRGEPVKNELGLIPIVVWTPDDEMAGLITTALMAMNDEYNDIFSTAGDDIRSHVDSVLKLWGIDDKFIAANADTIREKRLLPFTAGRQEQDAEYLSRVLDTEPVRLHLERTRQQIHLMGSIPDTANIVGATGATSGIALKLLFTPMQEAFESYSPFLAEAVHDRIELLNARWKLLSKPELMDYDVNFEFRIPVNSVEQWQAIKNLDGEVSHRTRLRLLSDIDDPEAELTRMSQESPDSNGATLTERVQQNEIAQAQLESKMVDFSGQVASSVAALLNDLKGKMIDAATNTGTA